MRNIYLGWEATVSVTLHMAKQVSKFVVSISFHKSSVNLLVTVHPHQHLELSNNFAHLFVALIFVSLITNIIDHFFNAFIGILVSSANCLFLSFAFFCIELFFFFIRSGF